ncbi:MAG: BlaI/MecI/CopY family transcriptional regulator [Saprospiraceae bacterium]
MVAKEDYTKSTLNKLVKDYFEGSMSSLVSFLVKENDVDIQELSNMLDALKDDEN